MNLIVYELRVGKRKDPVSNIDVLAVISYFNSEWQVPVAEYIIIIMFLLLDLHAKLVEPFIFSFKFLIHIQIFYPAFTGKMIGKPKRYIRVYPFEYPLAYRILKYPFCDFVFFITRPKTIAMPDQ